MLLRPYQETALAAVQAAYKAGKRAPLLCSPTGSGKSAMTKYMLGRTKKSALYLCHRENLMDMISADLKEAGLRHGFITANQRCLPNTYQIHIGMMQTVSRRLDVLPNFQWVISDEAHLAMSPTWMAILQHYRDSWHLGMSATPCRLDGQGLGLFYDEIVYGPSIKELTERGYLARARVLAPPAAPGVLEKSGKMSLEAAAKLLNTREMTGSAIAEMRKLAPGRQAVTFCCTRAHAEDVAKQFRDEGFAALAVDGTHTDQKARIDAFRARKVQVLVTVDLLTTGWDCPQVEVAIFLRHTQSLALYLQMLGRVLRIYPGKEGAVILDHVGNVFRHGLPEAEREWTLDGRERRVAAPAVRQCMQCYAVFSPAPRCPCCGYVLPGTTAAAMRAPLKVVDGELQEVLATRLDAEKAKAQRQKAIKEALKAAVTRDDFRAVAYRFGYEPGWGTHMYVAYTRGRQKGRRRA